MPHFHLQGQVCLLQGLGAQGCTSRAGEELWRALAQLPAEAEPAVKLDQGPSSGGSLRVETPKSFSSLYITPLMVTIFFTLGFCCAAVSCPTHEIL